MSKASQLRTKLNANLLKYGPMVRPVYKRVTVSTGGDSLIHLPGSKQTTTTSLDPQPLYEQLSEKQVLTANSVAQPGDYKISMSADAVTRADLQSKTTMFVLIDSAGNEEVIRVYYFKPSELQGEDIGYEVYASSTSQ
jgi:hypothetical protein